MDLRVVMGVLRRHQAIIVVGAIAAVVLATLSYFKPVLDGGLPRLEPRKEEVWQASEVLFLTQPGFPAGRTEQPFVTRRIGDQQTTVARFADPGKFTSLAPLYAQLANSDAVEARAIRAGGPLPGTAKVIPTADTSYGAVNILPMVTVFATAPLREDAVSTAKRISTAFRGYLVDSQNEANIPVDKRVVIEVVNRAGNETLLVPRKKTLPIVVLLAVLAATVALAFARDNTRAVQAPVAVPDAAASPAPAAAASAVSAAPAAEHSRFRPERPRAPGPRLGS
jgi:hypothetical protein